MILKLEIAHVHVHIQHAHVHMPPATTTDDPAALAALDELGKTVEADTAAMQTAVVTNKVDEN